MTELNLTPAKRNCDGQPSLAPATCYAYPSKSQHFFARVLARRQTPGNCVRCGHKNPEPKHKTCPRCLEAVRRRKKNNQPPAQIAGMLRRIASLEYAVANLQLTANGRYQKGYAAGKKAALKPHRKYLDAYPRISKQELSTMNHAYDARR